MTPIPYTPGMRLYAEPPYASQVGSIVTVERVTPSGRAVIPGNRQVAPDGYLVGTRGFISRSRYRPATEADDLAVARHRLAVRLSHGCPPLTLDECAAITAILDAADARKAGGK